MQRMLRAKEKSGRINHIARDCFYKRVEEYKLNGRNQGDQVNMLLDDESPISLLGKAARTWSQQVLEHSARETCSGNLLGQAILSATWQGLLRLHLPPVIHSIRAQLSLSKMSSTSSSSSSSSSTNSTENTLESDLESRSSQVGTSTSRSRVGTSTPQASTSFPYKDALGDIKDEAEENFDEDTWFTSDEKRNKMTKEDIIEILEEFPLPHPFSARVPALQEPANYGTDLETSVYEGQIRSGYRMSMHPFVVAFFNHYKMTHCQLVPNGWRKLIGLIYLVQTLRYPVTVNDFVRLYLERASKGKRKEVADEGSSPLVKKPRAHVPPLPPLVVEDIPADKDPIFRPRWTIKRGDSGMPSSHVSAQHLAHGVLPSDKAILEKQPHEAIAMAHVQAAYNAYCYSSQMHKRFQMAMDVACDTVNKKNEALAKVNTLDKEVKTLKTENIDLLAKVNRLEKRYEKLKKAEADIGNKVIQAFLDGTAGEKWLRKRTEDGLSIFEQGFQKAKELTMAKYPNLFLDDITVHVFGSPLGETAAPTETGDVISQGEKSGQHGNTPAP
ncbi:hypothetical protein RJ640_009833 [Escallonia rubra]|uniref:Transposase (putative) gypsy type domain-containing protein n=1 Tax=Escallonia rubra TaxID=112253 RepID=A0AA88RD59_9ASTE|nr:hypothetical protein RJ640_009833 [Escallonia rubra]